MQVLVTGGAGFIGAHVAHALIHEGHAVTILDNLSRGRREAVPAGLLEGDIADEAAVSAALRGQDAVIHLAGLIEVAESVREPLAFADANVMNSLRLLEAMRASGVNRIVFSSTATVYGIPRRLPIREDDPTVAFNPYGASKLAVEGFLSAYHHCYGLNAVVLRYFNAYGPGERHQPETHAIPNFIAAALAGRPIPLHWNGEQVRDFVYVEDLARAHTKVLGLDGYHVFNVGTERGARIRDVLETILRLTESRSTISDLGPRAGDVAENYASAEKLRAATGWRPEVGLEEGLRRTVEWFRNAHRR